MKRQIVIFFGILFLSVKISFCQGVWTEKTSFTSTRCLVSAFAIGNNGYIGTGNGPNGSFSDLWQYNAPTDAWTQMADLPTSARRRGVGFSVNNKGYLGLGFDATVGVCFNDFWEFDPVLNTWTQIANYPSTGRFGAIAFSLGSKGYVGIGADFASGIYYNDFWEYNPSTNSWIKKPNFPGGKRAGAAALAIGNKGYVGLGNDSLGKNYRDFWEFNPALNNWSQRANYPANPCSYAVGITISGKGYVGTGADTATFYDDWKEFNSTTNTWATMTSFAGGARFHMVGFGLGCRGYVGTGHVTGTGNPNTGTTLWQSDWWEFAPPKVQFASISSSGGSVICPGGRDTLHALGGNTYVWSSGETTSSIVIYPNSSMMYSVIETSSGFMCLDTAKIVINATPMILATTDVAVYCGSLDGSASVNLSSSGAQGIPPYTYLWAPTGQTTANATGLIASGNFTCTVSDASGCVSSATVSIVALGAPVPVISGNTAICFGDATTITASGGSTYVWNDGSTTASIIVSPTATTTYSVVAYVGDCHEATAATVAVYAYPVAATSGNTTICEGRPTTITATGGGTAPYTYSWNTGSSSSSISVAPTVATSYSVIVAIGTCKDTANVTIETVPSPTATITGNAILCKGDITTLTAAGGNTYLWNNNSTATAIIESPSVSTTYSVSVGNGVCTDVSSIRVNVFQPPVAQITGNPDVCRGYFTTLTAGGGNTYLWSGGETSTSIRTDTAGTYSVVATIGTCSDTTSVNVYVHSLPIATISPDVTIVQGRSTNLSSSGGVNYVWNNFATGSNITVAPQQTTAYCVTVYDAYNCWDTACVNVEVISCSTAGELYLPNAFSPDGDGENDELQVYFRLFDCIQSFRLTIFNRFGEKIYQTSDPYFKWNGIYNKGILKNTQEANSEVFVYVLETEFGDHSKISRKGNISLIR